MKRYYINIPKSGPIEVSESEFNAYCGTREIRPYALQVYRKQITIEDVPEELRESVQTTVNARIARRGEYDNQNVPASELMAMIEGVL